MFSNGGSGGPSPCKNRVIGVESEDLASLDSYRSRMHSRPDTVKTRYATQCEAG